jgi:hypothetical protein
MSYVERARIVLAPTDRRPAHRVAQSIGVSRPTVSRWRQRFAEAGVEGVLRDKARKPCKAQIPAGHAARVAALTCAEPPHQARTGRAMAKAMVISLRSVPRIWRAHQLQPCRLRTFKRSRDPSFAATLTDIVGLYIDTRRRMAWCSRSTTIARSKRSMHPTRIGRSSRNAARP